MLKKYQIMTLFRKGLFCMYLFKKLIDRCFPKLQKGDIVYYKGRKQCVIGTKARTYFHDIFRIKYITHLYLSIDGCILRERADGVILRKVGHKDIPDFKIGDRVIPKPVSDDEWMHYPTIIPFGIRGIITNKEGVVAYVDNGDLFTDLPNDAAATIWVEFEDLHRAIPLSPYHLEKPIEYDLI